MIISGKANPRHIVGRNATRSLQSIQHIAYEICIIGNRYDIKGAIKLCTFGNPANYELHRILLVPLPGIIEVRFSRYLYLEFLRPSNLCRIAPKMEPVGVRRRKSGKLAGALRREHPFTDLVVIHRLSKATKS